MTVYALIGPTGLYLLFAWLLSAAAAAWLSDRKGWGERVGLTLGLLLSVLGLLIMVVLVLVLPSAPGSKWEGVGPRPRQSSRRSPQ